VSANGIKTQLKHFESKRSARGFPEPVFEVAWASFVDRLNGRRGEITRTNFSVRGISRRQGRDGEPCSKERS